MFPTSNPVNKLLGIILIILCLLACTSGKQKQQGSAATSMPGGAGVSSDAFLLLDPKDATRKTTLRLTAVGFELSTAKIVWLVNGRPFTTVIPTQFDGVDSAKGDTIQAKAVVLNREVLSNAVSIVNSPPEITRIKLLPEVFKAGDTLNIYVDGIDADGEKITFQYAWTRNGEPAGAERALGSDLVLKRGDKISVRITPFDGEVYGKTAIISREIANFPPVIIGHNEFTFDGKAYTYQVRASDPDGDSLTYAAASPENGMTMDPATGLLRWHVPPEFKGNKDVSITVSDAHGGTASHVITISIQ